MKSFLIFTFSSVLFLSCSVTNQKKDDVKIISVRYNSQLFNLGKKSIENFEKITKIAFYKDLKLCLVPTIHVQLKDTEDLKSSDGIFVKPDTSFMAFIFNKTDSIGLSYNFDNFSNEEGKLFNVDSLLKVLTLREDDLKSLGANFGRLDEVSVNGHCKIEKFVVQKTSAQDPDSVFRYYNKNLKDIDFTFSKVLDNKNSSKFYKTLFIYNPVSDKMVLDHDIPRREICYEFYVLNQDRIQVYRDIFKKFSEEIRKNEYK